MTTSPDSEIILRLMSIATLSIHRKAGIRESCWRRWCQGPLPPEVLQRISSKRQAEEATEAQSETATAPVTDETATSESVETTISETSEETVSETSTT